MNDLIDSYDFFSDWMNITVCLEEIFDYGITGYFEYFNIYSSHFDIHIKQEGNKVVSCNFTSGGKDCKWWLDLRYLVEDRLINADRAEAAKRFVNNYESQIYLLYTESNSRFKILILVDVEQDEDDITKYIGINLVIDKTQKHIRKLSTLCSQKIPERQEFNVYHDEDVIHYSPKDLENPYLIKYTPENYDNSYLHIFDNKILALDSSEENDFEFSRDM